MKSKWPTMDKKIKQGLEEISKILDSRFDDECEDDTDWMRSHEATLCRIEDIVNTLLNLKWPTLEGRLNQPVTTTLEALKQMQANGDELTEFAEKELKRLTKKEKFKKKK